MSLLVAGFGAGAVLAPVCQFAVVNACQAGLPRILGRSITDQERVITCYVGAPVGQTLLLLASELMPKGFSAGIKLSTLAWSAIFGSQIQPYGVPPPISHPLIGGATGFIAGFAGATLFPATPATISCGIAFGTASIVARGCSRWLPSA